MRMRVEHYPHPQGWDEGFYALVGSEDGQIHYSVDPPGQHVESFRTYWAVREWASDRPLGRDEDNHKTAVRMVQRYRVRHPFTPTAITKEMTR